MLTFTFAFTAESLAGKVEEQPARSQISGIEAFLQVSDREGVGPDCWLSVCETGRAGLTERSCMNHCIALEAMALKMIP